MKNIINTYIDRFRKERCMQRRVAVILLALAVVVAGSVFWQLRYTGIALANETTCGLEEHTHDESCYETVLTCGMEEAEASEEHTHDESCYETVQTLICGLEEDELHTHDDSCYTEEEVLICELAEEPAAEGHVHDESCYEEVLACEIPEHVHTVECLIDQTADVETEEEWEADLPERTGDWADDVVAVAQSQIGYAESQTNFQVAEDGETRQGYTRYGAWYGNEYGDWNAMFVSFCLHYAAVPESEFPQAAGAYAWVTELNRKNLYADAADYTPVPGDLVFFDTDGEMDGKADRVGIVSLTEESKGRIRVIEGDFEDAVKENTWDLSAGEILGYGVLEGHERIGEEPTAEEQRTEVPEKETAEDEPNEEVAGSLDTWENEEEETAASEEENTAEETGAGISEEEVDSEEEASIMTYAAQQVLYGSGSIEVYVTDDTDQASCLLTVSDVPTNTKVSLDSPHITLTEDGSIVELNIALKDVLVYVKTDGGEEVKSSVAYLMLDEDPADEGSQYTVTAYDAEDQPLDGGRLLLDTSRSLTLTVKIWPIQTDTLCSQEGEDKVYTQTLIGASATSINAQTFTVVGSEGELVDMTELTGKDELYYGSIAEKDFSLTPFSQAVIHNGSLLPVDAEGEPVSGESLYMVYDRVYSFDVEVSDVVNEHTEDNGDTYLWLGDTFYIDQYHAQGLDTVGYTRSQNTLTNCGVWVQLGRIREEAVNGNTADFGDYRNVSYQDMIRIVDLSESSYDGKNAAETAEENAPYGIVGPYSTKTAGESYSSEPIKTVKRVTGHVGDEFTTNEVFGTNIVYMVTNEEYHTDWINLGSHASDKGYRAWFYWISYYYLLNNHEDQVEYLLIYQNSDGEVRLDLDEMGASGEGEIDDYWNQVKGLYTKRNSVIKQYMLDHQETLEALGVGFADTAGWMQHVQLRMYSTIETIIEGESYSGNLELLYSTDAPSVSWDIDPEAIGFVEDGKEPVTKGSTVLDQDNDQETKQYEFGFYINPEHAFNPDDVQLTVTIHAFGTLKSESGGEIVYPKEDPLVYTFTLTEGQLREAYDDCPNSEGYDIAVNLSEAAKVDVESSDQIILYKIWEDNSNTLHTRDDISSVSVTLERSKDDGETWEEVKSLITDADGNKTESGETAVFEISGDSSSDTWSRTLTSDDLFLTYTTESDETAYYQLRIKSEGSLAGQTADGYVYETIYDGTTVINSLAQDTIRIEGVKKWLDVSGNEGTLSETDIPDSVRLALFQDNLFYEGKTVSQEEGWSFSFTAPRRNEILEYVYTLCELDADGTQVKDGDSIVLGEKWYQVSIDGEKDEESGNMTYSVSNQLIPTADLPSAGGPGTKIFTLPGLLLIFGAGWLLYRNRKREVMKV